MRDDRSQSINRPQFQSISISPASTLPRHQVKKKAEAVVDREGMGEKEKSLEIRKMYKKALNRKKPETKLVVSKKGGKGVKGAKPAKGTKYKVVDPRLKKDKRAAERKAGKSAKKGKSGGAARRPKAGAKGKAKSGGKK